jgi:hypothetical protein
MSSPEYLTNEREVGLPPLSLRRKSTWDYYRIEFLPDGYPGRRTGEVLHPHPIYGPYVITDYVAAYKRTRDERYLEGAHRVAEAAVARMTEFEEALVFEYLPGTVSSLPESFYSGLTQGRYLGSLGQLDAVSDRERYADVRRAILRSFEVPAERGGVARTTPGGGLLLEEYSHRVPDYTLNGWTTATELIHGYAKTTGDEYAQDLFQRSVHGITDVLPLYDLPELANTRYRLTGPARLNLSLSRPGAVIERASIVIPRHGEYDVVRSGGSKWDSRILKGVDDEGVAGTAIAIEALLSRSSWPAPNTLKASIRAAESSELVLTIGEGHYQPLRSSLRPERYSEIGRASLIEGLNEVEIPIPWTRAELIAYPTNFGKLIAGKKFNAYHYIHIDTATRLSQITGDDMLAYYGARWPEYTQRWRTMPEYGDADLELERYKAS